jgi:cytochrome o ubiquinol oxidase operon protein cyoD
MNRSPTDSTGASRGSLKSYAIGFLLAIALTIFAFGLVLSGVWPRSATLGVIFAAAIAQMLVHLHYFLHLDTSSSARWNLLALIFTLIIMIIFVGGTIWIMYNLNYRMM